MVPTLHGSSEGQQRQRHPRLDVVDQIHWVRQPQLGLLHEDLRQRPPQPTDGRTQLQQAKKQFVFQLTEIIKNQCVVMQATIYISQRRSHRII